MKVKKELFLLIASFAVIFLITTSCISLFNSLPNKPGNPSPLDGATGVTINPVLTWYATDPDGDPLTFDIYFGTDTNPTLVKSNHTSSTYNPGTLQQNTTYYWKVVAKDDKGGVTEGSIWSFTTTSAPEIPHNPSPSNNSTNVSLNPTLTWDATDPDGEPLTFNVYFGNDPDNLTLVISDTFYKFYNVPNTLKTNTTYYWKVVAKNYKGAISEGPVWSFSTTVAPEIPHNPSPSNNSTNVSLNPTLTWDATDPDGDPLTFDIYFGNDPDNLTLVISDIPNKSYEVPNTLELGSTHYWKVVAKDDKGGISEGPIWSFTTTVAPEIPHNPLPSNNSTNVSLNPTLSWDVIDPDGDPLTFDVYFGTDPDNLTLVKNDTPNKYYDILDTLEPNTTYYWKIVAKDDKGVVTEGPIWSFTTTVAPEIPFDPSPSNNSTNVSLNPTLTWEAADPDGDPLTFDVYFGTDINNLPLVLSNSSNKFYSPDTLEPDTIYFWKVVVKDDKGGVTEGPFWIFTTTSAPEIPFNPSPSNNSTNVSLNPTLTWNATDPDEDPLTFDVYFGTDINNLPLVLSDSPNKSYSPDTLELNTIYYWKVVVKDDKGGVSEGPVWSFATTVAPEIPFDPSPSNNSTNVSLNPTLTWEAADPDGDPLTFDVYFGTDINNLPLVLSDSPNKSYSPDNLELNTIYYWKVVAKDDKGAVTEGPVWSFATKDTLYLAAVGWEGLYLFDVSDPNNIILIANNDFGYSAQVYVDDSFVYVANGMEGLLIYDINNINTEISRISGYSDAIEVKAKENYIFTAYGSLGLVIFDVNSLNWNNSYVCETEDWAWGLDISDKYAYVATGFNGLEIFDITDPTNPIKVGHYDTQGDSRGVVYKDNYVYIADIEGIVALNVEDPTNPIKVWEYDKESNDINSWFNIENGRFAVSGNYLYLLYSDKYWRNVLAIFDISDPTNINEINKLYINISTWESRIKVYGNYAYIASKRDGLVVYDISNPESITDINANKIYQFNNHYWAKDSVIIGNHLYVSDDDGLIIYDITNDPENPMEIGNFYNSFETMAASNNLIFGTTGDGFSIIDVTIPDSPIEVSHVNLEDYGYFDRYIRGIVVLGNQVIINDPYYDGSDRAFIFDVSNISSPTLVGIQNYNVVDSAIQGQYAYSVFGEQKIFMITDLITMTEISSITTNDVALGISVSEDGNYAYLAEGWYGFSVYDISDKTNPQEISHIQTKFSAFGISIYNNYAYVDNGLNGVVIINISDPHNPYIVNDLQWGSFNDLSIY